MNRFMRRYPSPSLIVSITALIVSLGGAGYSATGGNFILGAGNTAATQSSLSAHRNGRTLQLWNSNTGASATPLALFAAAGRPPFTVNSATKVANLNADRLDGLDSLNFARSMTIPFNLAANGAMTGPIALPVARNVLVMTTSNTQTQSGMGSAFATVTRLSNNQLSWVGLHSCCIASLQAARGTSGTVGDDMLILDSGSGGLILEVAGPGSIRIVNNWVREARAGTLTLLW